MRKKFLGAAIVIGLVGLVGVMGLSLRKTVTLVVDGETRMVHTYAQTVGQVLDQAQVSLAPGDRLLPEADKALADADRITIERASQAVMRDGSQLTYLTTLETVPLKLLSLVPLPVSPEDEVLFNGMAVPASEPLAVGPAFNLEIRRSVPVTLEEGERTRRFSSTRATLGQALWDAGIRLTAADRLSSPLETLLSLPGLEVSLVRAQSLTIVADGQEMQVRSAASTVGEALAENGLALQGLDFSSPSETAPLPTSGLVRVVRVSETVLVEQTPVEFETEFQPDPETEIDHQTIVQTGEYGLRAQRVRVRSEDGLEVSRQVEGEWLAVPPKNRIVGYGTQIVMHTLDTPDGPIQYWRALTMWATSYRPGNTSPTTASGLPLRKGVAAIDRRYVPFYTRMYIPGYGEAVAADVGGGVVGRWIDLGYSDSDYVSWHQWVTVYFLWPPPDNIVWIIP